MRTLGNRDFITKWHPLNGAERVLSCSRKQVGVAAFVQVFGARHDLGAVRQGGRRVEAAPRRAAHVVEKFIVRRYDCLMAVNGQNWRVEAGQIVHVTAGAE